MHPVPHERRFAIVTDVGHGMQWTRAARLTKRADADGEVVWSLRPDAGVQACESNSQVTVTTKPGHRGEHEGNR
jgi:hypothetical protein